jgi:carbamoyl-phosphate synthase large subunit
VHSGDSACSLPPYSLSDSVQDEIRDQTRKLAIALKVVGLMNIQFAVQGEKIFLLEVNPRASRTVPYVSKAIGKPLAMVAARCMTGKTLAQQGMTKEIIPSYYSVKEAVFPFIKFPGVDPILGPEMKSTGEVMGVGTSFAEAYAKSQLAVGVRVPQKGAAFISVRDADKEAAIPVAKALVKQGFALVATGGTAVALQEAGLECERINKVLEGRPHVVDMIKNEQIDLIVNTTEGKTAIADSFTIRREALQRKVTYTTTISGAHAMIMAMAYPETKHVYRLQDLHKETLNS